MAPSFLRFQTSELSEDYPKEHKNQMGTGFDSIDEEPLQVSWIRRIKSKLYTFISKSMGFFNQK
jgi:hypothetical protein